MREIQNTDLRVPEKIRSVQARKERKYEIAKGIETPNGDAPMILTPSTYHAIILGRSTDLELYSH